MSGALVVVFSALLALPLAYLLARYEFRGKLLLQTAATLPLVIPPFVGAVALQLILGRSGMVNLLLMDWFDTTIPFMEGLDRRRARANAAFLSVHLAQHRGVAVEHRLVARRSGAKSRLPRFSSCFAASRCR